MNQPQPQHENPTAKLAIVVMVVIAVSCFLFCGISAVAIGIIFKTGEPVVALTPAQKMRQDAEAKKEKEKEEFASDATFIAEKTVKARMKHPGSVEFDRWTRKHGDAGEFYVVTGEFSAKNSFGMASTQVYVAKFSKKKTLQDVTPKLEKLEILDK